MDSEWDGGSVPFVGSSSPNRDQAPQPLWSDNRRGQPNQVPSSQEQEGMNHNHIRPRSQESSMTVIGLTISTLNMDRKMSFNDSSSSTPSSKVDYGSTARGSSLSFLNNLLFLFETYF